MMGRALTRVVEWNAIKMVRKKDSDKKVNRKMNITHGGMKIEEKRSGSGQEGAKNNCSVF